MHVFENTKIRDAAKSLHPFFWASKPKFFHILTRDTENNHSKQVVQNVF